jgi:hypothetical protein
MPELYQIAKSIASRSYFIKNNIVVDKEWSFPYLKYRILRPLLKLYNQILIKPFAKNKPWLSPASISILQECLDRSMTGLEYGSGRSTLFFAKRVNHLICIEHHSEWFELISRELSENNIKNIDYIKIPVSVNETKKEIENRYKQAYQKDNEIYVEYYERVSDYPDSYFDFIIIDGRARVECSKRAIPKLKSGGIFILDNSERKRYQPVHKMLNAWKKVNTTSGLTDTTFWFKP